MSSSLQVAASEIRICLAAIGTVVRMGDVHEQGQTSYVTDETPMIKCGRDKTKRLLYIITKTCGNVFILVQFGRTIKDIALASDKKVNC